LAAADGRSFSQLKSIKVRVSYMMATQRIWRENSVPSCFSASKRQCGWDRNGYRNL